jgi:hypothetical protein
MSLQNVSQVISRPASESRCQTCLCVFPERSAPSISDNREHSRAVFVVGGSAASFSKASRLREKRRYQGDLSASINDALLAVNLNTVKLVTLQGKQKQTARETQVVILRRLIRKIQRIADARGCSMNQLVNSGLLAYYAKERRDKLGIQSRPTRQSRKAIYDRMSPEERQHLAEAIASLAGLQEGPKTALPDGTHYEYDAKLKRTVEVDPSGRVIPVSLVAGELQRDLEKPPAPKATP